MKIITRSLAIASALFTLQVQAADVATRLDLSGGPSDKLTSLTQCAGATFSNVMTGEYGRYHFMNGFSKEERTGFINRKKGKVSKGCIMPSLQPQQVLYFEVDDKVYQEYRNAQMQCIRSDNMAAGAVNETESRGEYPSNVTYLSSKDVLLHCGNDQGVKECATGRNSQRGSEYKKQLKARGKTMMSVMGIKSTHAPAGGEKLYCQHFNSKTGKSLFAFEYIRMP